jgi:hypothetical protein
VLYDITIQLAKEILLDGVGTIQPDVGAESGGDVNATVNLNM